MIEGVTADPDKSSERLILDQISPQTPLRSHWFAKIEAKQQQVSSMIMQVLAHEYGQDLPSPIFESTPFISNFNDLQKSQGKLLGIISHLNLPLPHFPVQEQLRNPRLAITKPDLLEWLKKEGYASLAEKMENQSGYPWSEFEKIRSPALIEQLVDIHSLCLHKGMTQDQEYPLLNFALHLANLIVSAELPDQYPHSADLHHDTIQVLGQLIYLLQSNPQKASSIVDISSIEKTLENIKQAFSADVQDICERLQNHYLLHQSTQLQDPEIALHTRIPIEIAKALLTDIGTINFGIIDALSAIFLSPDSVPINHEINLSHALKLLQHSPQLRDEFEKIHSPRLSASPSIDVIQAALGLPPEHSMISYDAQLTTLIAILSHLRQGGDRSCFAISVAIEILSAHLGYCFKDLKQLLEEGKLTRSINKVQKDIPFIKKISDENLHKILVFNQKGELIIHQEKLLPLWHAPGILAACQSVGIIHPKEAILSIIAQLPPPDQRGLYQIKTQSILQKLCENASYADEPNRASLDHLYTLALFAFSSQTCQPLLKVWENSIANMAEAEEGSMVKRAILESTLDALQFKLGELKFPRSLLLQRYFLSIQKLLYEGIRLIYDPTTIESPENGVKKTEGGFVLYYHNYKINDEKAFRKLLHETLFKVKNKLEKMNLTDLETKQLNEVSVILNSQIDTDKFIGYLLARYHRSNEGAVRKMSQGIPIDYSRLRFTPWITRVGNDSKSLLKIYLEHDQPLQSNHLIVSGAEEALTQIIDMCKKMPEDEKEQFVNNPNKLKPLCIIGKHRLPFMAGNPSLASAWQKKLSTPDWIENFVIVPGREISKTIIDAVTRDQFIQNFEAGVLKNKDYYLNFEKVIKLFDRIPQKSTIKQFRNYVLKICQSVQPSMMHADTKKMTREIDTILCQSLEPKLKKRLEVSAVHFADTNWCNGIQDLHFCFAVNPGTGKLELWEGQADGTHLMALDQNYWLNEQKWEFLTLPQDNIPDDSIYLKLKKRPSSLSSFLRDS